MNLKEKIIVVTGAASGIGRALAIRFNQEGAKKMPKGGQEEQTETNTIYYI